MSFDTEVVKDGRGRAIRVDASSDGFATITYRWGDVAGLLDGTNMYSARVLELGQVDRGFGQDRIAAAATTSLRLDNADGAIDAICGKDGLALAASLRFRVYVVLYEPGATFSPQAKLLGEFSLSGWPKRTNTAIDLSLADDFIGRLGPGLQLPTFVDWQGVGTTTNNPIKNSLVGLPETVSPYAPIQLAFGEDWVLAHPHIIPVGTNAEGETYFETVIVPLYVTTDTSAVSQSLITRVRCEMYLYPENLDAPDGIVGLVELDRSVIVNTVTYTAWTVEKSPTITKDGRSYQIVYLVVRTDLGQVGVVRLAANASSNDTSGASNADFIARREQLRKYAYSGGYDPPSVNIAGEYYKMQASRVIRWYVQGVPLSQRTNAPVLLPVTHAVDVVTDLVSVYSDATVDSTSAARVKAGIPNARAAGTVNAWNQQANSANIYQPPMSLRQVLTNLAQSSDMDVFIDWDGNVAFSSDVYDFTTATQGDSLLAFREEDLIDIREWVPSDGERGAAFNRVYLEGGKTNPADGPLGAGGQDEKGIPLQGPWDITDATIPVTTRIIEVGLQQGWRPYRQQLEDPIHWRNIDPVSRPRISFRTHLGALRLELGDYFKVTWTRGTEIGGPYTSTVFQCESISYAAADDTVEVEAVWRDDSATERQYLLDDETLLVRSKGALSGQAMFDGSETVEFGGTINLTTMGVVAGDVLVLRSSAEAADSFTFNAAYRITDVPTTTTVTLIGPSGLPALSGADVPNAEWSIVRGATTYPTAISDPTNYPSGGEMYGKMTDASGDYSDTTQGNRLING